MKLTHHHAPGALSPAGDDGPPPSPLRFERRGASREAMEGLATAFELGGPGFGRTHTVRLLDYSCAGAGGVCDLPIVPGTSVSLGFQTQGYPARRGVVVRCLPCGDGYRIAIAFENRLAA